MLTREDLLSKRPPAYIEVPCEPLGGSVGVKTLTAAELYACRSIEQEDDSDEAQARYEAEILVRMLCDAEGRLLFSAADPADVAVIAGWPWYALRKLFLAAERHNYLDAKSLEALRKN